MTTRNHALRHRRDMSSALLQRDPARFASIVARLAPQRRAETAFRWQRLHAGRRHPLAILD